MYIGDTDDGSGLHHMVFEVVDNAIDEALAGYCDRVEVILNADGSVTVRDNGRGIPTDIHEGEGVSAAEVIMTRLHAGGKFNQNSYKVSGGLHGVGVSVVNALSEWLELRIWRNRQEHMMRFRERRRAGGAARGDRRRRAARHRAHLHALDRGLHPHRVQLRDARASPARARLPQCRRHDPAARRARAPSRSSRSCTTRAASSPSSAISTAPRPPIHQPPILIAGERDGIEVQAALEWNDGYHETTLCFTNNIPQRDGGAHLDRAAQRR